MFFAIFKLIEISFSHFKNFNTNQKASKNVNMYRQKIN